MVNGRTMRQWAPYPEALANLVAEVSYRPGWSFRLEDDLDRGQGSEGLTLVIQVRCADSYNPERDRTVLHYMPVPPAAFLERDWRRWLLDQILLVEAHEACEFFTVAGVKPYAPNHGPGRNPYTIVETGTPEDAATPAEGRSR